MELEVVLKGALPPIVLALALVSWLGARALPLAMAGGLYIAHGLLKHWPALPNELWSEPTASDWVVWCMVGAALFATLEHVRVLPARLANSLGVMLAAFSVLLMLEKVRVAQEWENGDVWLFVGGGGAIAALTVHAQRKVLSRAPASILPAVLWAMILSLDAGIVVNGQIAFGAQLCGAVAAAVGAAAGTKVLGSSFSLRPADALWLSLAHVLFLLFAVHLGDSEWAPVFIALAAPLLLLLLPRGFGTDRPWRWFACAAALTIVPLAVSFWFWQPPPNPYGY